MTRATLLDTYVTGIDRAVEALRDGRLISFPTETVYGLGGDATNPEAVAEIYRVKQRPASNPLISHVADLPAAEKLGVFTDTARRLAQAFWPGPLTLVLSRHPLCPVAPAAGADLGTIAIRIPAHPIAQTLLKQVDFPVVAPSANLSGYISPTRAQHVLEGLGDEDLLILDGGPCEVGVESTIVNCAGDTPVVLRQGGITAEALSDALGSPVRARTTATETPTAPGMFASHYAPRLPVILNAVTGDRNTAFLGFGGIDQRAVASLSPTGDLTEAATNLYHLLRAYDRAPFKTIAVAPIPDTGLGAAINDRLRRAAAPRSAARNSAPPSTTRESK